MAQKTREEIIAALEAANKSIRVGDTYRHYKSADRLYKVIGIAFLEAAEEPAVIYQHEPEISWIRPISDFLAKIEFNGSTVDRFSKVEI